MNRPSLNRWNFSETKNKQHQKEQHKVKEQDSAIDLQGKVVKILPGSMYRVQLENGMEILCHLSGKMRKFNIKIALGDMVSIEVSPYDLTKGRITYRQKG